MRAYVLAPLLGFAGAAVGVGGVMVHRTGSGLGLALGLATAVGCLLAAAELAAVPGAASFAVGWTIAVVVLAEPRDEGDFLVADDTLGGVFLWGGVLVVAVTFVAAVARTQRAERSRHGPPRDPSTLDE